MAYSKNAPFRADVVGSFLRPDVLKQARADFAAGVIDAGALRAVEDHGHVQLGQRGGVHVGVDGGGNIPAMKQLGQQGIILPFQLGRGGDIAVGGGIRVQIQRAEAAHAQRVDVPTVKKSLHGRHRYRRFLGGDGHSFQFLAGLVKGGQHHFGAAGFQCANRHERSFFPE